MRHRTVAAQRTADSAHMSVPVRAQRLYIEPCVYDAGTLLNLHVLLATRLPCRRNANGASLVTDRMVLRSRECSSAASLNSCELNIVFLCISAVNICLEGLDG